MNSHNFDIERMRKTWVEMGKALGMETPPSNPDNMNKMKTDLDRLTARYLKGWNWSIIGGILFTILFLWIPWINDEYRTPLALSYAIVMFTNAYALYWLWRGTGKIEPLTMSITQVSSMAKYYKKCHLLYILIGFPVAILWIGYFIFVVNRSEFRSIEGIVIGSIVGGIYGLYGLRQYLRDYRNLSE